LRKSIGCLSCVLALSAVLVSCASTGPKQVGVNPVDRARMVMIPSGMAFVPSGENPELVAPVEVAAFSIYATEVTVSQFDRFIGATGYVTDAEYFGEAETFGPHGWERVRGFSWRRPNGPGSRPNANEPVRFITHADARAYCEWAGGRLPTLPEWVRASRGRTRFRYPWGDRFDPTLVVAGNVDGPGRVGVRGDASGYGVRDLSGNVAEWLDGGVLAGGSYNSHPRDMRVGSYATIEDSTALSIAGFRCVCEAE
jgi:sulfatase modifying factor 1